MNQTNTINRDILIFGASGHAKVLIDAIEKQAKFKLIGLIDDNIKLKGQIVYGYPVLGTRRCIEDQPRIPCLVAIGENNNRLEVANWLASNGFPTPEAIIHPTAILARGSSLGPGTVAIAGSIVNSDTVIGKHVIINTGAKIDHDCNIGDGTHIAPGATICGGVSIGSASLIGAGAVLHPNITIGHNVIVGAGSTVLDNVGSNVSVVGVPAKPKNQLEYNQSD